MQKIEVLKYEHPDYEVIVRTDDINSSWTRFKGRIGYYNDTTGNKEFDAQHYCRYTCGDEDCELYLSDLDSQGELIKIDGSKVWKDKHPVIFETNKYHITVKFKGVDSDKKPRIKHIKKEIENFFFFDWDNENKTAGKTTGVIDFLNEPGVFRLDFEYWKNGRVHDSYFTFEVVSPKLDTRNDYKSILEEVNREYEGIIFRYLSTTFQQFGMGTERSLEIWMQVFQGVVRDYLKNVERIIKNPHSKVRTLAQFSKADRIKHWTNAMEEEYAEKKEEGRLEEHYFSYKEYETTVNSLENRFVKYTLQNIGGQLNDIFKKILVNSNSEISDSYRSAWNGYKNKIEKLQKHPFFRSVGKFEGLRQESLVLQSRMGYQQIYKSWLKLRKGIAFYEGSTNIGTLQIWEIYELWCFIKVKNLVRQILGFNENEDYPEYIEEPNGTLIKYDSSNKSVDYRIKMKYPKSDDDRFHFDDEMKAYLEKHEGEEVTLHYQHTFNRSKEDDFDVHSVTTEQRPDIVLNIKKADGMTLTYLYDAKYRVWSDKNIDKEFEDADIQEQKELNNGSAIYGADYPPSDAINQMHRYRDAIYYALDENNRPRSKEIIGGYILFPGRGDDKSINQRYFSRSIEKVNIGAFPLLPITGRKEGENTDGFEGCRQLYYHLCDILLKKEIVNEHIKDSIPQRGLYYSIDEPKDAIYMIMTLDKDVNTDMAAVIEGRVNSIIMGREGMEEKNDIQTVRYIVPVIPGGHIEGYYKVVKASLIHLDGNEYPIRIKFVVAEWTKLNKPARFGMTKWAFRGVCKTREEFFEHCEKQAVIDE